jgi:hypothetical protein
MLQSIPVSKYDIKTRIQVAATITHTLRTFIEIT